MRRATILGVVLGMALILGACAPANPTSLPTVTVPNDTDTPIVVKTETPAETATAETATESPTAAATTSAGVRISTSTSTDITEPFLVDQEGRTLYVFTSDVQNSSASTCTGDCLTNWPPVLVTDLPSAGTGVDATMLGMITRDDGTMQATYNGWPLYYYASDLNAGDKSGQGVGGVWFVVSGAGTAIQ